MPSTVFKPAGEPSECQPSRNEAQKHPYEAGPDRSKCLARYDAKRVMGLEQSVGFPRDDSGGQDDRQSETVILQQLLLETTKQPCRDRCARARESPERQTQCSK